MTPAARRVYPLRDSEEGPQVDQEENDSGGLSRSALIRRAIERMLEDIDDVAVSEVRLSDADDAVVSWEQVKAEAGL